MGDGRQQCIARIRFQPVQKVKTRLLKLSEIVTTAGTQIRASINADAVDQYAEAMMDSANKFPPVVVFHDGNEYILADGFHRVMAATRNGFKDIDAEVIKGTKSDALKYALGANSTHGIPRSRMDKKRSVELALEEWPKISDRELSKICAVSASFVGDVRKTNCSLTTVEPEQPRIGADGKTRRLPTRTQTAPDPEPTEPITPPTLESKMSEAFKGLEIPPVEPPVTQFYCALEAFTKDALERATDKQLNSMGVYAAMIPKLIKQEIARRATK